METVVLSVWRDDCRYIISLLHCEFVCKKNISHSVTSNFHRNFRELEDEAFLRLENLEN
jgi:hypothetical protein